MPFRVMERCFHENSIGEQGNGPALEVCVVRTEKKARQIAKKRRTERPAGAGCWTDAWAERVEVK